MVFVKGLALPPNKLVILAGAGLSCGAGLPASVGLAEGFKSLLLSKTGAEDYINALRQLHYYLEGAIRFQKAKLGLDPAGSINIEELCIAARTLHQREQSSLAPFVSGWHPHLEHLIRSSGVQDLLANYIDELYRHINTALATPETQQIAFLDRFVEWSRAFKGLHFFTLNYDTSLEEAVSSSCQHTEEVSLIDGFDDHGGAWKPELLNSDKASFFLYKLHGSLDWFNEPEFGLVCRRKLEPERVQEMEGDRPHLIFGIESKLTGQQPFFTLTHKFYERLSSASLLLVIGYSFADVHINSLIEQSTLRNPFLKVLVANRNATSIVSNHEFVKRLRNVMPTDGDARKVIEDGTLLQVAKNLICQVSEEKGEIPF